MQLQVKKSLFNAYKTVTYILRVHKKIVRRFVSHGAETRQNCL